MRINTDSGVLQWAKGLVVRSVLLRGLALSVCLVCSIIPLTAKQNPKALQVIAAAVEALGGERYLGVETLHSSGRYFFFRRGRKGFSRFWDWTAYQPVKSRFQMGEGDRQEVFIYNLEIGKGWKLEGEEEVEEISEERIQSWWKEVQKDLDILLKKRLDEEGMSLFYYGQDDIAGQGEYEAVEFVDATNTAIVVFFDVKTHLPSKLETHFTNSAGVRQKQEVEWHNWHTIQGVHTPLRTDTFVEGEIAQQLFVEEIVYNVDIPPGHFKKPQLER